MTDKPDLTKSVVGKMIDAEKAEIVAQFAQMRAEQEARDKAQDAKLARPSTAIRAVDATLDITSKYPVAAWIAGTLLVVGSLAWLDGVKLYIGCGVGMCFVPGLPKKVIGLFRAFKNGSTGPPTT